MSNPATPPGSLIRRVGAWFNCNKRPANARRAWLMAVGCMAGLNEYRCPCGRCDLPVIPPAPVLRATVAA